MSLNESTWGAEMDSIMKKDEKKQEISRKFHPYKKINSRDNPSHGLENSNIKRQTMHLRIKMNHQFHAFICLLYLSF